MSKKYTQLKLWGKGARRLWGKARRQWIRADRRYGMWWRAANAMVAAALAFTVCLPLLQQLHVSQSYRLDAATQKLVGATDSTLANQLQFDSSTQTYEFNQSAVQASSDNPINRLQAQVGSAGKDKNTSLYALDVPQDFSKGVTYHDINSGLSFSLVPEFTGSPAQVEQGHLIFPLVSGTQAIYTLKNNGLKEDIVVQKATQDTMSYSYRLELPDTLEAKVIPGSDGDIGIYSADPALFGNITYGSSKDQASVQAARVSSPKTYLVFGLPSPVIKTATGANPNGTSARFELRGNQLSVVATGLSTIAAPFTIDPSVIVSSASDFGMGNDDSNIAFGTSGGISRGNVTGGGVSSWSPTSSLNQAASGTGSAVYNGYMYLVSGSVNGGSGNKIDSVQFAPIQSSGALGSWHYTHNSTDDGTTYVAGFGQNSVNFSVVVYNGYLYVVGGNNGSIVYSSVFYAPLNSNGTVGSWNSTSSMNTNRYGFGLEAYNGYMYAMGGCSGLGAGVCSTSLSSTEYAPINGDGSLGSWTLGSTLTITRLDTAAAVYNGYMYVTGGCKSISLGSCTSFLQSTEFAPILSNGSLGAWAVTGSNFTTGRSGLSAFAYNGWLYILGGRGSGTSYQNDVQVAPLYAGGGIGSWVSSSPFTTARTYLSVSAAGNYLYLIGGCTAIPCSGGELGDVQSASIASPPSSNQAFSSEGNTAAAWAASSTFNGGIRYGDTSVAYNGYLYVIGGYNNSTYFNDVQYAPIGTNGVIGTWQYTYNSASSSSFVGGFYNGRYLHTTVLYNGYLYILGGRDATNLYNDVQYAPINANGTVGTWQYASSFINARWQAASAAYNGYMYLLDGAGNTSNTVYYNDVQFAKINSNGTLGTWNYTYNSANNGSSFVNGFYNARRGAASVAYNGYLYIVGGVGTVYYYDVQFAPLNSDGTVGTWNYTYNSANNGSTFTGGFTTGRCYFSLVAYNNYLYILGGFTGSYTNNSQYALINSDGTIGTWASLTNLFTGTRGFAGAAAASGYLYIVGGANSGAGYSQIQEAPLASEPRTGLYTRLINFGNLADFTTFTYTGAIAQGDSPTITYQLAGSNGVFSAAATMPTSGTIGAFSCSAVNTQYVFVSVLLDDSYGGGIGSSSSGSVSPSSNSQLANFSLVYYTLHPPPNIRLRSGQTLQNGILSPLDTCYP